MLHVLSVSWVHVGGNEIRAAFWGMQGSVFTQMKLIAGAEALL